VKNFWLIAIFISAAILPSHAQTNAAVSETATNKTQVAPQQPRGPTTIDSDSAVFDGNGHKLIYYGLVRVNNPQMKLTCAQLTADLPQDGGRINHIVAETNVVIDFTDEKGQTSHATSERAVYFYEVKNGVTNETVTLTGNPRPKVTDAQGTQEGDPIIWDRTKNSFQFNDPHMVFSNSAATDNFSAPK
jgi:lipopolysaccharide export system protein LptA